MTSLIDTLGSTIGLLVARGGATGDRVSIARAIAIDLDVRSATRAALARLVERRAPGARHRAGRVCQTDRAAAAAALDARPAPATGACCSSGSPTIGLLSISGRARR